jgi:hypothetical protein
MKQEYFHDLGNLTDNLEEQLPRIMFVGTYILGVILIILATIFAQENTLIVLLVSIIPMIIYGIYVYSNRKKPNVNTIADSAYFLGFLFTITSISLALYFLTPNENDLTKQFNRIIQIFGFALITTIIGLLIKVCVVNLKPDLDDLSENIMENLHESVSLFDDELVNAIERFQEIDQQLSDRYTDFTNKVIRMEKDTLEKTSGHLDHIITNSGQELEKFINESGQSLTTSMEESSKTLTAILTKVVKDIEEGGKALDVPSDLFTDKLSEPLSNMKNQINEFNNELSEVIKSQRAIASNTEKVSKIVTNLAEKMDIAEKLPDFVTVIDNSINGINLMTDTLKNTGNKLNEITQSFEKVIEDGKEKIIHSNERTEQMKEDYKFFQDYNKKMKDTLMQSKLNMEILSRELTTAADIIVKKLDDGSDN